jgi:hypothetical protein
LVWCYSLDMKRLNTIFNFTLFITLISISFHVDLVDAATCSKGKCVGTTVEKKQCEKKKQKAGAKCKGVAVALQSSDGAQRVQITSNKNTTELGQKLIKGMNSSGTREEMYQNIGNLSSEQKTFLESLKGPDGQQLLPSGGISNTRRETLGHLFKMDEKQFMAPIEKAYMGSAWMVPDNLDLGPGTAWTNKPIGGTFSTPGGNIAFNFPKDTMLAAPPEISSSFSGKSRAIGKRVSSGGKQALTKRGRSKVKTAIGSSAPGLNSQKGSGKFALAKRGNPKEINGDQAGGGQGGAVNGASDNMGYTGQDFRDNEIRRSQAQLVAAGSLKTFAFYGKHMPTICPDYRQHNSAILFVRASQLFTVGQTVFMAESHRVNKLEKFFVNTEGGLNYFSQEDKAKDIYRDDIEHFSKLVQMEKEQINNAQFAAMVKIVNTFEQDILTISRQLAILDEIVDGYNAAALMAEEERRDVKEAFSEHDSDILKGETILAIPGGMNLMGHIANLVKYVGGISMLKQANKQFDRRVDRHNLNCSGPYQPMKTPESRQIIALNSADKAEGYRKVLQHKLKMVVDRYAAYKKLISQMNDRLNSDNMQHTFKTHQQYQALVSSMTAKSVEFGKLCFTGSEERMKYNNCSCITSGNCLAPPSTPLRVASDFGSSALGSDVGSINRKMQTTLKQLYTNSYSVPKSALRKLDGWRKKMEGRYDRYYKGSIGSRLSDKDRMLHGFSYKYNSDGRLSGEYQAFKGFIKNFNPDSTRISHANLKLLKDNRSPYRSKEKEKVKKIATDKQEKRVAKIKGLPADLANLEYEDFSYVYDNKRDSIWKIISKQYNNKMLENRLLELSTD